MGRRTAALSIVVAVALGFVAGRGFTEDEAPDPEAMKKAMEELGAVGAPHKTLASLAGTWSTHMKWTEMDGTAKESRGTATFTPVLGGRYVRQDVQSSMDGKPFEGVGYLGFENARQKYVSVWMDSMGTGLYLSTGDADPSGKKITYAAQMYWIGGQEFNSRDVFTIVSDKQLTFEMFMKMPGPDGTMVEQKGMEITYTRE
jgi:hypothetical protein